MSAASQPTSWSVAAILEASGGDLLCGDRERSFAAIGIDSRTIRADNFFIAIRGEVHDGHDFVADVIAAGVSGLMIDKRRADADPGRMCRRQNVVAVSVRDTVRALGDLAAFRRRHSAASVVAITGSNGKTSTRNMTAAVVARRFRTLATSGNLNNHIGLPLTLLKLTPDHQWAVVEIGMNRPGEIDRLAEICAPEVGVITNVGPAHLEGLGTIEAVLLAKSELLAHIKSGGTAVLNADDHRLLALGRKSGVDVLFYGISAAAAIQARGIETARGRTRFTLVLPSESIDVELATPAGFMVSNALAAAAVGYRLGVGAGDIKSALESFRPVKGRLNTLETRRGVHIIDDTYNANPNSMAAALRTLQNVKANGRAALVAGDMRELGEQSEALHREIGALAAELKITRIYATGTFALFLAQGALHAGMDADNVFVGSKEDILSTITAWLQPGDWVLVKGSRSMAMETVVAGLKAWAGEMIESTA